MVDPLSVSSLTLQLVGTARELRRLWKLLSGASAEFSIITDRLELVNAILQELTVVEGSQQTSNHIVLLALERSQKQLEELRLAIIGLQLPTKGFKRKCSKSLKIIASDDKVRSMRDLLQILLSDLSLTLQLAQGCKISRVVEASFETFDQIKDIKRSISYFHDLAESHRRELHSSPSPRSLEGGVAHRPELLSEPSLAFPRYLKRLSHFEGRNFSAIHKEDVTHRQWRVWLLWWVMSWDYQCCKIQKLDHDNLITTQEQFRLSLGPLTSLVPGLVIQMARDRVVPRIYMRVDWIQLVPVGDLIRLEKKGELYLKQEIETGRLSANACVAPGQSLLNFVALSNIRGGGSQMIKYLIDSGADTSVAGPDGLNYIASAVGWLALSHNRDTPWNSIKGIVEELDVDLTAPSRDGSSLLHGIAKHPFTDDQGSAWSLFAPYGLNVNAVDNHGWTPLLTALAATYAWDEGFFWWLIDRGADVSQAVSGGPCSRQENGITCLHLVIAALQPIALTNQIRFYVGPHDLFAHATIPAQSDKIVSGCHPWQRGERIDPSKRQAQRRLLKVLISKCADLHAVAKHWGTPTDIAKYTGNTGFWCSVLEDCDINVANFLACESTIHRNSEIRIAHEVLEHTQRNRRLVLIKLREFWTAFEQWNTQAFPKSNYAPLPLGHRSALRTMQNGIGHLPYFLLRMLSNKRVDRALLPTILICTSRWMTAEFEPLLRALELECDNNYDIYLIRSSFFPHHLFIKSYCDGSGFETRAEAFLEFMHVCQAKATGTWTIEQEKARQTDMTRARLADDCLLRILQILTMAVGRFQWPDEVMGWGEAEDLFPSGNVPGQWVDDEYCGYKSPLW